jgi:hypothetical protein
VYEDTQHVDLEIKANGRPGPWQLRFFRDKSHDNMCGVIDFTVIGKAYECPVTMTVDKPIYQNGETVTVNVTSTSKFDEKAWIGVFPESCPSREYNKQMWGYIGEGGKIEIKLEQDYNQGPYEVRYFPTPRFQPLVKVPFKVESDKCIKLSCDRRVLDGKYITIRWDTSLYPETLDGSQSIGLYPKDMQCTFKEDGNRHYLQAGRTSMTLPVESGVFPSGNWQVRLFLNAGPSPHVVCDFMLIGVFEMFFEKMSKNPRTDVDIICKE